MGTFRYSWNGFSKYGGVKSGGATGFGVRLLSQLIEDIMNNIEQTLSIIKLMQ